MERIRLIDPEMGASTNAQPNKFGVGKHGYKYGAPGTRTRVTKDVEDCHQEELMGPVEEEDEEIQGDYTQLKRTINGKIAATALLNVHQESYEATFYPVASTAHNAGITLLVGKDGYVTRLRNLSPTGTIQPVMTDLQDVVYAESQFVICGKGGKIVTSPDGIASNVEVSGVTDDLYAIAYGAGNFVAVGLDGLVIYSADAETWLATTAGVVTLRYVFRSPSNSKFYALAEDGAVWGSTTGAAGTWSQVYDIGMQPYGITEANGAIYVAGTDGTIFRGIGGFTTVTDYDSGLSTIRGIISTGDESSLIAAYTGNAVIDPAGNVSMSIGGRKWRPRLMRKDAGSGHLRFHAGRAFLNGFSDFFVLSECTWR